MNSIWWGEICCTRSLVSLLRSVPRNLPSSGVLASKWILTTPGNVQRIAGFRTSPYGIRTHPSNKNLSYTNVQRRFTSDNPSAETNNVQSSSPANSGRRLLDPVVAFYRHYGFTALTLHLGASVASLAFWLAVVRSPFDLTKFLGQIGLLSPVALLVTRAAEAYGPGNVLIAYVLHKACGPLRLIFTLLMTPYIVRRGGTRQALKMAGAAR